MKIPVSETGTSWANEEERTSERKTSLRDVLQIPIDFIDFNHVRDSKDGREVEKIYRILKSGEEGHYPDLENFVKNRLGELKPKSIYLRAEEQPMLRSQDLTRNERQEFQKDLLDWTESLKKTELIFGAEDARNLPPIRNESSGVKSSKKKAEVQFVKSQNPNRIKQSEYDKWEKYDAEFQLLQLSVQQMQEEEQKAIAKKKGETLKKGKTSLDKTFISVQSKPSASSEKTHVGFTLENSVGFLEETVEFDRNSSKRSFIEEIPLEIPKLKPKSSQVKGKILKNPRRRLNVIIEDIHID